MPLAASPLWLLASLAGVGLLLAVGIVHALAIRVLSNRKVHDLRVRATQLRIEHLRRIAERLRGDAEQPDEDRNAQAPIPDSDAANDAPPARRAA